MNVKSVGSDLVSRPMPRLPQMGGHRGGSWLLAAITLSVLLATAIAWTLTVGDSAGSVSWLGFGIASALGAFGVLMVRGQFRTTMTSDATSRVSPMLASVATGSSLSIIVVALLNFSQPDFRDLLGLFAVLVVAGIASHVLAVRLLRALWMRGRLRASALVYGADDLASELAVEIGLRPDYGVDVVGFIANAKTASPELPGPVFDPGQELVEVVEETGADRLVIGPGTPLSGHEPAIRLARGAASIGMPVFVVPRFFEMGLGVDILAPDRARGYPLVRLQRSAHPQVSIRLKRLFDASVAAGLLLLGSPLMLVVALLVKTTSRGPVLFGQTRIGQHGHPIVIRKFRSMTMSASSDHEWTAESRVTWLGRWIRRLNLDEIPQLYAVLVGDMSLVGPRPERPIFVESFRREVADYDCRHRMPVGITGLAQIVGLRGDTSIAERIKYDNLYIDQWSFRSDLRILAKTVPAVFRQGSDADRAVELERALEAASAPRPTHRAPILVDLTDVDPDVDVEQPTRAVS